MRDENITLEMDGVAVEVVYKRIRNIHLRVYPPLGRVTVSVPLSADLERVRKLCFSKIGWIKKQQEKIKGMKFYPVKEYISGEEHYYLGEKFLLSVIEGKNQRAHFNNGVLELYVKRGAGKKKRKELLEKWYKARLEEIVLPHIERLERTMKVKVAKLVIRAMRSRWGTCQYTAKKICLNTLLAKKEFKLIEYVVIHELAHLLEKGHQKGFKAVMDKFSPEWRKLRRELRRTG